MGSEGMAKVIPFLLRSRRVVCRVSGFIQCAVYVDVNRKHQSPQFGALFREGGLVWTRCIGWFGSMPRRLTRSPAWRMTTIPFTWTTPRPVRRDLPDAFAMA